MGGAQVEAEDAEFEEEFLSKDDPSILHFLLAAGDEACPPVLMVVFQGFRVQGPGSRASSSKQNGQACVAPSCSECVPCPGFPVAHGVRLQGCGVRELNGWLGSLHRLCEGWVPQRRWC